MTRLILRPEPAPSPAQAASWRQLWGILLAPHPREASGQQPPAGDGAPAGEPCPRETGRAQESDDHAA
jgi:hypothetical protein